MGEAVVLRREKRLWVATARRFKVFADGAQVGSIRNGGTEVLPISTGNHEIEVRLDWARARLPVTVETGHTVELWTGLKRGFSASAMIGSLTLRNLTADPNASREPPTAPVIDGSEGENGALTSANSVVAVHMNDEVERVVVHSESIRRRSGGKNTISLSRTIEHTVDMARSTISELEGSLKVGPLAGAIRREISRELGTAYTASQTVSHEVEVIGSAELRWVDVWRHGVAVVEAAAGRAEVQVRLRERTELEVNELPVDS